MGTMFRVASSDTPNHAHMKSSTGRHLLRTQTFQVHSEKYPHCILYDMMPIDGIFLTTFEYSITSPWFSIILHDSPCNYKQFFLGFFNFSALNFWPVGEQEHGDTQSRKEHDLLFHHLDIAVAHEESCRTCRNVRFASFCIDSTILC